MKPEGKKSLKHYNLPKEIAANNDTTKLGTSGVRARKEIGKARSVKKKRERERDVTIGNLKQGCMK